MNKLLLLVSIGLLIAISVYAQAPAKKEVKTTNKTAKQTTTGKPLPTGNGKYVDDESDSRKVRKRKHKEKNDE